jgi:hypothetical protein
MKKLFLFFAAFLILIGFNNCDSSSPDNAISIPEGEYTLAEKRDFQSLLCGMSETTFGKTLLITESKIETHPLKGSENVSYEIKKIGDDDYLTKVHRPLSGDTITIEFTHDAANSQLCFSCNGEKIIYQK